MKFISGALFSFLVWGTLFVSANGLFEGFKIVNVKVNGDALQGDVPAIELKGRTMVPIRFVSEALGADVGWDDTTNTAIIELKKQSVQAIEEKSSVDEEIQTIKLYGEIADVYKTMMMFGVDINNFKNHINDAFSEFQISKRTEFFDREVIEFNADVNKLTIFYNMANKSTIKEAKEKGINLEVDIKNIYDKYIKSIELYNQVKVDLYTFKDQKSQEIVNRIIQTRNTAFANVQEATLSCDKTYQKYMDLIQSI